MARRLFAGQPSLWGPVAAEAGERKGYATVDFVAPRQLVKTVNFSEEISSREHSCDSNCRAGGNGRLKIFVSVHSYRRVVFTN